MGNIHHEQNALHTCILWHGTHVLDIGTVRHSTSCQQGPAPWHKEAPAQTITPRSMAKTVWGYELGCKMITTFLNVLHLSQKSSIFICKSDSLNSSSMVSTRVIFCTPPRTMMHTIYNSLAQAMSLPLSLMGNEPLQAICTFAHTS